jgi:flagellar hook-basal body complex protein FliE
MMAIEAIGALRADFSLATQIHPVASSGADFVSTLDQGLSQVDNSLKAADLQLRRLAAGEDIPVHDVMLTMEQARMDLMLAVEVRNRLVEAYQELMRMQV